jgi:hypothetical protein
MTALDFETSNEAQWSELEKALTRGEKTLDPERILFLYRTACEHLALAEARGFPAPLVSRLSALTARAHQIVYRQTDLGLGRIARTLMHAFPAGVRAHRWYVLLAALLVVAPAVALGYAVAHRPDLILSLADSTTVERFGRMYDPANPAIGRVRDAGTNWMMFGFYIANNIGSAASTILPSTAHLAERSRVMSLRSDSQARSFRSSPHIPRSRSPRWC